MKVLELFAGTRSIGRAFERRGHEVFSVDWGDFENIDLKTDISTLTAAEVISRFGRPDVIWASPDCTSYSLAAISYHRERPFSRTAPRRGSGFASAARRAMRPRHAGQRRERRG